MRAILAAILLFAAVSSGFAAPAPANVRTIKNISGLPREALRNAVSRKFYRSLEVSPVEGWIVVRAQLVNGRASNPKVVRSDANGAFDTIAIKLADEVAIAGLDNTESKIPFSHVDVHLLVYKIADGTMFVAFWHIDDARYSDYRQMTTASIGILKKDGQWVVIEPPKRRR